MHQCAMRIHISSFRQILNDTIILQNKYNFHVIYCNDYRIYFFSSNSKGIYMILTIKRLSLFKNERNYFK